MLGASRSGKSTFFKQLQNIYGRGFNDNERLSFRKHIFHQIIEQMKRLVSHATELSEEGFEKCRISCDLSDVCEQFELFRDDEVITNEIAEIITILWNDSGIQNTFDKRAKLGIAESSGYFFDKIHCIAASNYIPTSEDVLKVRYHTTRIVDKLFTIKNTHIRIFDISEKCTKRKKWLHCFQYITAIIFVASLSGYDETIDADGNENVMHNSINLFADICNNKLFHQTAMILFLNKRDLFETKINPNSEQFVPLTVCFHTYNGPMTSAACLEYIQHKFEKRQQNKSKHIFVHATCATDKTNVQRIFYDIEHITIKMSLDIRGLI